MVIILQLPTNDVISTCYCYMLRLPISVISCNLLLYNPISTHAWVYIYNYVGTGYVTKLYYGTKMSIYISTGLLEVFVGFLARQC